MTTEPNLYLILQHTTLKTAINTPMNHKLYGQYTPPGAYKPPKAASAAHKLLTPGPPVQDLNDHLRATLISG